MIKTLKIKNYIIIDEIELEFENGFNSIAGETGAGKSIIISAINVAFGAKTNKDMIKTGEKSALIELVLCLNENFDRTLLEENGIELFEDENELIISREINQGSSRSRINGVVVSNEFMKSLSQSSIDIHSQHQTYSYMQKKYHINLLDSFDKNEHQKLLLAYKKEYEVYKQIKKQFEDLQNSQTLTENQIEFLKFQIDEIEEAQIEDENEDEMLSSKINIMLDGEKLKDASHNAYEILYQDEFNVVDLLSSAKSQISKCIKTDQSLQPIYEELENIYELARDVSSQIRSYCDNISTDEEKLIQMQERIDILNKLKRKYGNSLANVKENLQKFKTEYENIELKDQKLDELREKLEKQTQILQNLASSLSDSRKRLGLKLSKLLQIALEKLELPKARFEVAINKTDFNELGFDDVEFLISTNVSESLKPLAKVASGGEISRVMLALKTIFAKSDNVATVVFDEIDTGISGKASSSVAKAIDVLSATHQVICISHQPIIIARSKCIFYVSKTQNENTKVCVEKVVEQDEKARVIAILASGNESEQSVEFAYELLSAG